jgi:hypothetical protein
LPTRFGQHSSSKIYGLAPADLSFSAYSLDCLNSPPVLLRLDHVASCIVNANHGVVETAEKLRISHCVANFAIPQATEWKSIGDQIKAAMIPARSNFVNVFDLSDE